MTTEPIIHIVTVYADYEYDEIRGAFMDLEEAKAKAYEVYKDLKDDENQMDPDGATVESWQGESRMGFWNYRPGGY
jgi:hypothetical protein